MPLSWCISHPIRLVIAVAKGEFDPQDMVEFVLRVDAANARPYRKMIDVTGVTTRFSADRIRRFAEVIRQREEESEVGPIGVVAGSPDAHRQAILFAKQAQWHRPIKVFHEQHDARKWLDAHQQWRPDLIGDRRHRAKATRQPAMRGDGPQVAAFADLPKSGDFG